MRYIRDISLISFLILLLHSFSYAEPIAVIVNKDNQTEALSLMDLKRIFTGRMLRWQNGEQIIVVNKELGLDIRTRFYKDALDCEPDKQFFITGPLSLPFRPMIQKTDVAAKRYVAGVPGAISYIMASEVDDTVKVLRIDGLMPNEAGYKLGE